MHGRGEILRVGVLSAFLVIMCTQRVPSRRSETAVLTSESVFARVRGAVLVETIAGEFVDTLRSERTKSAGIANAFLINRR